MMIFNMLLSQNGQCSQLEIYLNRLRTESIIYNIFDTFDKRFYRNYITTHIYWYRRSEERIATCQEYYST